METLNQIQLKYNRIIFNKFHQIIRVKKSYKNNIKSIKNEVGYLTENNPLYFEMYVIEYLKYVAELYQLKKAPIDQLIEQTGLINHYDKKIRFLSKGYKQRVGIAAALINNPKLIIFDEPSTGLDPNQLIEIRKLFASLIFTPQTAQ